MSPSRSPPRGSGSSRASLPVLRALWALSLATRNAASAAAVAPADPCAGRACPNPGNKTAHSGSRSYPYFYCCPTGHSSDCGRCYSDRACHCNITSRCCVPGGGGAPPGPGPPPPPPPAPAPPARPPSPYAGRCSTTAYQPGCTCGPGRVHPPFGPPANAPRRQLDYHFPIEEPAERATLETPALVSVAADGQSAVITVGGARSTLTVGGAPMLGGWELLHADAAVPSVVLEHDFDHWSQLLFVSRGEKARSIRKPVGRLDRIRQPLYDVRAADPEWPCKQDVDPTDWLGNLGRNISGGEETTIEAAATVMAPNADAALLGNPEEANKFQLTNDGTLGATPWARHWLPVWQLSEQNTTCRGSSISSSSSSQTPAQNVEAKMGMAGRHLRVVDLGRWYPTGGPGGAGCGEEVIVVAKRYAPGCNFSTALLRLSVTLGVGKGASTTTSYSRAVVTADGTRLVSVDALGCNGSEFYEALAHQKDRWDPFVRRGAAAQLPGGDVRYVDTATSLLTMYMNEDKGLTPDYGMGQFWNNYNIYIPLDTNAIGGALLEWGHTDEALRYIGYFFANFVNRENGTIIYGTFIADNLANYGRALDMFVSAVEYSSNITWARELLPTVHAMAAGVLRRRASALAAFPPSSPLHGIVPGSPDHDLVTSASQVGPGFYFNNQCWFVRGLLSLHRLHVQYPALSLNATLQAEFLPTANAWRENIHTAATFTAVRRANGDEGWFFLSPVVGSVYGMVTNTSLLLPGGSEEDCVERKTCYASMSAALPGGGSNQITDYSNFDMFSETLLSGVLAEEFEAALMDFRESHRGTLLGMTRFRDVLDDLYILGYGRGALAHDRLSSFHNMLAGHSMNFLSRGTYWSAEERAQLGTTVGDGFFTPGDTTNGTGIKNSRYRNDCGVGNLANEGASGSEDCSLDMISSVVTSYWVRWMLVSVHQDEPWLFIARGAPRRWYQQTTQAFGIERAPTRFGRVSFTIRVVNTTTTDSVVMVAGSVLVEPPLLAGGRKAAAVAHPPRVAVHIRSRSAQTPITRVAVVGGGATLSAWHVANETAWFALSPGRASFNFTAV
eukprot:SAG22_NODE_28_length_28728_cov_19.603619_7_plen_1070_part_00